MSGRKHICAALVVLLAGCSGQQAALDAAGDQAATIGDLWTLMLWVCGFMYLLVLIFLAHAIWRARHALDAEPLTHGSGSRAEHPLRMALGGWVGLIVVGLFVLSLATFFIDRSLAQARTDDALKIKVTAAQWWWKVEYEGMAPDQRVVTANELRLPVGQPALLELHAEDVIHSLWIPNLGGKEDLIPGRINSLLLTPRREGEYRGQCAEFCGLQHAKMALDATVMNPDAFTRWRQQQLTPAPAPSTPEQIRGHEIFMSGPCAACHQIAGTPASGQTGPNLTHLASRRTIAAGARPYSFEDLRDWLRDPQSVKPGNHMPVVQLSDSDLNALTAYLDSLK
ncbi:cytochrome c oxidase subunit II [Steroidobacter sp. S1-65]|uniref:cytochrome-c oxidase n=1 Tax=Steroidobacter gossypii TaxID=2805490 RepID=A0ABS1X4D4_9GAMM|nr:cytochrome c oxidase subunit II [Steroidobacter gossypii]MBM0108057.1 cytochrome c oxidase subunit II [Steroidobacter gossypii]